MKCFEVQRKHFFEVILGVSMPSNRLYATTTALEWVIRSSWKVHKFVFLMESINLEFEDEWYRSNCSKDIEFFFFEIVLKWLKVTKNSPKRVKSAMIYDLHGNIFNLANWDGVFGLKKFFFSIFNFLLKERVSKSDVWYTISESLLYTS